MSPLRTALIQQRWAGNREAMVAATGAAIRQAAQQGAQLVVCQELHTSAYFCQREDVTRHDLAEPIPGPSTDHFGALAKELGVVLVISLFERRAAGLSHNTAVVLESDGQIAGTYRKMHIPDDPGFTEKFYFAPGDRALSRSKPAWGVWGCWCAGTSGTRKRPG
jgi:N-carbamoylputrescine amidase